MIFCKSKFLKFIKNIFVIFILASPHFANADISNSGDEYKELMETYTNNKLYNGVCWLTSHNSFAYNDPLFTGKIVASNQ